MHLHFFESQGAWQKMLPLTYTRPVADLRVGILKIHEKWERRLGANSISFGSQEYLSTRFNLETSTEAIHISANLLPDQALVSAIKKLDKGQSLLKEGELLAFHSEQSGQQIEFEEEISLANHPWDLFRLNKQEIEKDFDLITIGRESQPITDPHTKIYGDRIFLEEGATTKAAILNSEIGAIYLGKNSSVEEGAIIKGSFAMGEGSIVNMGAKLRGDTSIGPFCKIGGEVSNSVIHGYSNKGHDGFLGNSVLGEWCNLGADTNTSNMKNNYTHVKMWDFESGRFKDTGLQFCGLVMGDHSKCGINTMFNTGTTVGVSANIFGDGFPRNIIPSFAWGGASGFSTYKTKQACDTAESAMKRRNRSLSEAEQMILQHIFELTSEQRIWEK